MKYKKYYGVLKIAILMIVLFGMIQHRSPQINEKVAAKGVTVHASEKHISEKEEGLDDKMRVIKNDKIRMLELGQNEEGTLDERFLKVDGNVLRDKAGFGQIVQLRGTNVGGWQVMEAWMCPTNAPDQKSAIATLRERFGEEKAEELIKIYEKAWWQEDDFDNVKGLNFNVLRLPISYLNLQDEEGKLREDTLATYDWFVEECAKRDIYVILDLHAAPGSQNGRDHSGDISGSVLFTDKAAQDLTISLWVQLAEHYKGNPTIAGYGLLNEPEGNEEERAPWGEVQLPFFDRLYQAIRAVDSDHIIIFNAIWEPTNMPNPSQYGWENVMYEYHFYGWDGIDNVVTQRSFIDSKVENNRRAGHNVPVLVGEFTMFEKLPSWEYALQVFNEQGWSWTTWTYKTVGMGSWGIFNSSSSETPKVDIYHDEADVIAEKWSKVTTKDSFTKNQYIHDLLRVMADEYAGSKNNRKWFQNFEYDGKIHLRTGTDADAELVSSKETYTSKEESQVIKLTVTGAEKMPTVTSRNVCVPPMIRNSVNAIGMQYLILHTYARQGNNALYVTLVDGTGATWSQYTMAEAMPVAYKWEKLFLDLKDAKVDLSNLIEIRIGVNKPGTYYFDDIYFATSYTDPLPEETEAIMQEDSGSPGIITDWESVPKSSVEATSMEENLKQTDRIMRLAAIGSVVAILVSCIGWITLSRKRKRSKNK
ncbi:MAG: glycoside hydrolase family 5 protein [Clostridiales bacterium]|nr:glycoside hydrolase family 5 protein [Clostridiales bacterium]